MCLLPYKTGKMAKQLKVQKSEEGTPVVQCPRCDEVITPNYFEIFDGYHCPECDQTLDSGALRAYRRAAKDFEDSGGME